MFLKRNLRTILPLLAAAVLFLAACAPAAGPITNTPAPTADPDSPVVATPGQPQDGEPTEAPWLPQTGDENLIRREIELETVDLLILESFPPQFRLHLVGTLPTPCSELRVDVQPADAEGNIPVEVYALIGPAVMCAEAIESFDLSVPLENLPTGKHTVLVNGEPVGEVDVPDLESRLEAQPPHPGETRETPVRPASELLFEGRPGSIYIDDAFIERNADTGQYSVRLSGNLPTPCHQLKSNVQPPDENGQINVNVFSVSSPDSMCIQVLEPFSLTVPLEFEGMDAGALESGEYTVLVNGEAIGTIQP